MNSRKNESDLTSFRQNLDYIWSDVQPETKEELRKLMYQRGFRIKNKERLNPTNYQLELAWEYIKPKIYIKKNIAGKEVYKADDGYIWIRGYTYYSKRHKKQVTVKMYRRRL